MLARAARPKALPLHADTAPGDDATVIVTPARLATARGVDSLGSLGTAHRPAWQGTPLSSSTAGTGIGARHLPATASPDTGATATGCSRPGGTH